MSFIEAITDNLPVKAKAKTEKIKENIKEKTIITANAMELPTEKIENKTEESIMGENHILIDIENVFGENIAGMYRLSKNDFVYVAHKTPISAKTSETLLSCPATVEIFEIPPYLKKDNAADEFLMMEGVKQATIASINKMQTNICIISKDADLQKLYEYTYQFREYVSVNIFSSIQEYLLFSKTQVNNKKKENVPFAAFIKEIRSFGVIAENDINGIKNIFKGNSSLDDKRSKLYNVQINIFGNKKLSFEDKTYIRERLDYYLTESINNKELFKTEKSEPKTTCNEGNTIKENTVSKKAVGIKSKNVKKVLNAFGIKKLKI